MAQILVVDDQKDFRDAIRIFLERKGHEVIEAEDGIEAVELCRSHHPAVVILDVFLPGKDGIEALWQIREEKSAGKVIVVSAGRGTPWSRRRIDKAQALQVAKDYGADVTLAKPVVPARLMAAVDAMLGS